MRLNITEKARELYAASCPVSTSKCLDTDDVDYKIQRCIDLGRWKVINEDLIEVTYYHNTLVVLHNELVDMYVNSGNYYAVDEWLKAQHFADYYRDFV